jgi:hypothetical protein
MTYEHLTGRLVETQRSMLGESAIEIARSVDGVTVTDDGNVTAVDGDGRDVVAELAGRYVDVLGKPAEQRLAAAAREFEEELVLPPVLGGPDESPAGVGESDADGTAGDESDPDGTDDDESDVAGVELGPERPPEDRPARHGPAAAAGSTGAVSDGGTVTLHSPTPAGTAEFSSAVEPSPGETGVEESSTQSEPEAGDDGEAADESESDTDDDSDSGPLIVRYSVATDLEDTDLATANLESVYLLPTGESGWQVPVTVADAVVNAVAERTDFDDEQQYELTDSIDTERLFRTLAGENGETVSFHEADVTVTFHRSGSLAVH